MAEQRILDKVSALLERANHKDANPNERDECLRLADKMMGKYSIEQAMLDAHRQRNGQAASEPTTEEMSFVRSDDEFYPVLMQVITTLMTLCSVRVVLTLGNQMKVVGFPDDIEYFRMMWTGSFLVFSNKLNPRWDNDYTLAANIRRMKESGVKWPVIWDLAKSNGWLGWRLPGKVDVMTPVVGMYALPFGGENKDEAGRLPVEVGRCPKDGGYFKRLYEKQCELDGVQPSNHTQRHTAYRESYAYGFLREIQGRTRELMTLRQQQIHDVGGAQVALRSRMSLVDALYELLFGNRLVTVRPDGRKHEEEAAGNAAGHAAGREVDMLGGRNRMGGRRMEIER